MILNQIEVVLMCSFFRFDVLLMYPPFWIDGRLEGNWANVSNGLTINSLLRIIGRVKMRFFLNKI